MGVRQRAAYDRVGQQRDSDGGGRGWDQTALGPCTQGTQGGDGSANSGGGAALQRMPCYCAGVVAATFPTLLRLASLILHFTKTLGLGILF